MTPIAFDQLMAYGFMGTVPEPRDRPIVVSAVLQAPDSDRVYSPPFELAGGLLASAGAELSVDDFDVLVERGEATRLRGAKARSDGCFYFRAGSGPAEYTSLSVAASRLNEFADEKVRQGDRSLAAGRDAEALSHYELAAATSQRPEHYAKMLLIGMPEHRKQRITEALHAVATTTSAQCHVDEARREINAMVFRQRVSAFLGSGFSNYEMTNSRVTLRREGAKRSAAPPLPTRPPLAEADAPSAINPQRPHDRGTHTEH
jgi:hypothetical protein